MQGFWVSLGSVCSSILTGTWLELSLPGSPWVLSILNLGGPPASAGCPVLRRGNSVRQRPRAPLSPPPWLRGSLWPDVWGLGNPGVTCSVCGGGLNIKLLQSLNLMCLLHVQLEKAPAPHSSSLAWKIPWTEGPGRPQSMGSLGVGHDWATSLSHFTFMHWRRTWQPTPVLLPGESQGQGSLVGPHLWGRTESDTTEAT